MSDSGAAPADVSPSVWLKDLLPNTPGLVRKIAKRELMLAVREFYEQSFAWLVVTDPAPLVAGQDRYFLSPYNSKSDVVGVIGVELAYAPLRNYPRKPVGPALTPATPFGYYCEGPDVVRLWPAPDAVSAANPSNLIAFQLALTPWTSVNALPSIAQTHHYEAIRDGVLGRLYSQPSKPYTNAVLSAYHMKRFRAAIGEYAAKAKRGYNNGQNWTYPRFGK